MADEKTGSIPFMRKMLSIQRRLKAPKSQYNSFGKYNYRNCEDILEALKPLLDEYGVFLNITDEIIYSEGRFYMKATVTAYDTESEGSITSVAYAREPENKKGSDQSQVTGSASTYARKYALNAMFLIDDNKDADFGEPAKQPNQQQNQQQGQQQGQQPPEQVIGGCKNCGTVYSFAGMDQFRQFAANPNCCANPDWMVL